MAMAGKCVNLYKDVVLDVVHRPVSGFLLKKAGIKRTEGQSGGTTFVQRYGPALI